MSLGLALQWDGVVYVFSKVHFKVARDIELYIIYYNSSMHCIVLGIVDFYHQYSRSLHLLQRGKNEYW